MDYFRLTLLILVVVHVPLYAQRSDFECYSFVKADSIAATYDEYPLNNLNDLSLKLTKSLTTEPEKFRAIYTWVCRNIANDYELYVVNKEKREKIKDTKHFDEWNRKFSVRVFRRLLHERKTICSGYAYLVRELAQHAGISCVIVDGYGRNANANIGEIGVPDHSWNAVRLNGKWYLCDPNLVKRSCRPKYAPIYKAIRRRILPD